jgi:hypothetical protein
MRQKEGNVPKTRAFISFDYDHDEDLRNLLVGQAANPDSPFEIADWSIKDASPDWKQKARQRIKRCEVVIVIVGQHMATATGVTEEIRIAREEHVPMFGLHGRSGQSCPAPAGFPKVYNWTWDNLKKLIGGAR